MIPELKYIPITQNSILTFLCFLCRGALGRMKVTVVFFFFFLKKKED